MLRGDSRPLSQTMVSEGGRGRSEFAEQEAVDSYLECLRFDDTAVAVHLVGPISRDIATLSL